MSESLLEILQNLRSNPALVVNLYQKLFEHSYYAFVQTGSFVTCNTMKYLTYETADRIQELPLFTQEEFIFENTPENASLIEISGLEFWQHLLTVIKTGECEAAIDPGQNHGIRLTKEMILSMILQYDTFNDST